MHDDQEIAQLEDQLRAANRAYWEDAAPIISDYDYDALVEKLKALAPDSALLKDLGTRAPADLGSAVVHTAAMLSLDKCYSDETLLEWANSFEGTMVAMPKYDGIACSLHYDERGRLAVATTRGDGVRGDDITINAQQIADIPKRIPVTQPTEVRGEIYMRLSVFAKYKAEGKANPRNLAAGAIKQKAASKSAAYGLSFAAYDIPRSGNDSQEADLTQLVAFGFPAVDHFVLSRDNALSGYEQFTKLRASLDYEIDGVVYKTNSRKEQTRLGSTSHHPRYAIAYKFQGDSGLATLLGIEWSVARTGAITPVALVSPVNLSGVTVSRASLHNVGFIDKLGLTLGAKVTLVRRGGVIPNVEFVSEPGAEPVPIPRACPSCGSPVIRERDFLYCTNKKGCKAAVLGGLSHFAAVLDMLGFGESVLEQGYDAGILRVPGDFFRLTAASLAPLQKIDDAGKTRFAKSGEPLRLGETVAKKLVAEVDKKKSVDLATFLRALGINELGKNVSKILGDKYLTIEGVLGAQAQELAETHGIGETIAKSVVEGLAEARLIIDDLRTHVTLLAPVAQNAEGPLRGVSFVFTGKMVEFARSEGEKRARERGADVLSSVTKTLNYLVVGADKSGPKSTKEKAAEKLLTAGAPIKVITEAEFLALLDVA